MMLCNSCPPSYPLLVNKDAYILDWVEERGREKFPGLCGLKKELQGEGQGREKEVAMG